MRRYEVQERFGLDHLRIAARPEPALGPGQVRVMVRACSLNYRDLLMVRGHYDPRLPLPLVPLSDGVGEVLELGPGVQRVALGQRVIATFAPTWIAGEPDGDAVRLTRGGAVPGMLSEQVVLGEGELVPVPAHLTDAEAATLPCAALTAWSALVTYGGLKAGDTVLTLGTGGVSVFALQIARLLGARVIATTSSEAKAQRLRELGAGEVLLYPQEPRWGRAVRRQTGGVDHVVEVGGAGTLAESLEAVRPGGTVSLIGVLAGVREPLTVLPVLMKQVRVQGILVGHRQGLEALCRAVDLHALRPVVDQVFPFAEVPAAFAHLASGQHVGKVCVEVG
ncbi:MAG: NAD(P)-dependent alcohol dehydrogenase [Pseudomonadota bacterium]